MTESLFSPAAGGIDAGLAGALCPPFLAAMEDGGALWILAGWLAQALIAAAIFWQYGLSAREGKFAVSPGIAVLGMVGGLLGAVYALVHREWVFVVGQALVIIAAGRLLTFAQTPPEVEPPEEGSRLPVVAPDSAEIKLRDLGEPSSRKPG